MVVLLGCNSPRMIELVLLVEVEPALLVVPTTSHVHLGQRNVCWLLGDVMAGQTVKMDRMKLTVHPVDQTTLLVKVVSHDV